MPHLSVCSRKVSIGNAPELMFLLMNLSASSLHFRTDVKAKLQNKDVSASSTWQARLMRLGTETSPRDLPVSLIAPTLQPWHGSHEDLAAALIQLIVWKIHMQPDQREVDVRFFVGLLRSESAVIGLLASKHLQQTMQTRSKDLYLKALNYARSVAQKRENHDLLQNPFLLVSTLIEAQSSDASVNELVAQLRVV